MNTPAATQPKRIWIALGLFGLLPAIVILALFRLSEGQLVIAGQTAMEYDLARMLAAQISLMLPLFLLVPLALASTEGSGQRSLLAPLTPFLLFGPGLLAGLAVGGSGVAAPGFGLILLAGLAWTLYLWMLALTRFLGFQLATLTYAAIWAISKYVDYLQLYVLPSIENPWLRAVGYLNWLLPQVESGPSLVDDFLQGGPLNLAGLGPTFIQFVGLGLLLFWLQRRAKN